MSANRMPILQSKIFFHVILKKDGKIIEMNNKFYSLAELGNESSKTNYFAMLEEGEVDYLKREFMKVVVDQDFSFSRVLNAKINSESSVTIHWEFSKMEVEENEGVLINAVGYPFSRNKYIKFALTGVVNHLELVFERNPDILVVMDQELNIVRLNPAAKSFLSIGNDSSPNRGDSLLKFKNNENIDLIILLYSLKDNHVTTSHTELFYLLDKHYQTNIAMSDSYISFLMRDVTESKVNQRKLLNVEMNLRHLLDNNIDSIIYFNNNYQITYFNYSAINSFYINNEMLMNIDMDIRLFFPDFIKKEIEVVVHGSVSSALTTHELFLNNKWWRINIYRISDPELEGVNYALNASDITSLKILQLRLQSQNENLRKINWRQSHELRAPLSNILGLVSLITQISCGVDQDLIQVVNGLKSASEQLDGIVHQIVNDSYNSLEEI